MLISPLVNDIDKLKIPTKTAGLGLPKNYDYALTMTSQTLWWLPKLTHYGAVPSRRRSTSLNFDSNLAGSILPKQDKLTFDRISF